MFTTDQFNALLSKFCLSGAVTIRSADFSLDCQIMNGMERNYVALITGWGDPYEVSLYGDDEEEALQWAVRLLGRMQREKLALTADSE